MAYNKITRLEVIKMEIKIKNVDQFIEVYQSFEKVRAVLYGADTGIYIEKTNTYQDLVDALSYFIKKTAKTEDKMIIDAKLGLGKVKEVLEKEQQILRCEIDN
jgi:hypothetical protein